MFFSITAIILILISIFIYYNIGFPSLSSGIYGKIGIFRGNCIPPANKCTPRDFQTKVYISKLSLKYVEENLITSAQTDKRGYFNIKLPPGKYSLFVEYEGKKECVYMSGSVGCVPFTVRNFWTTKVDTDVDKAAW